MLANRGKVAALLNTVSLSRWLVCLREATPGGQYLGKQL